MEVHAIHLSKEAFGKLMMYCASAYKLLRLGKPCSMGEMIKRSIHCCRDLETQLELQTAGLHGIRTFSSAFQTSSNLINGNERLGNRGGVESMK